jgi:hypothetical protein
MDQLVQKIPTIKTIYEAYEAAGYDKDKILEKFKDTHWIDSLKTASALITYKSVSQELADQDSRRSSWTNEDPDLTTVISDLDADVAAQQARIWNETHSNHLGLPQNFTWAVSWVILCIYSFSLTK